MVSRRPQTRKKTDLPSAIHAHVAADADTILANLLIFQLGGESFGLPLATVAEIIRLPDLAHMPLVPRSLLGLANLRGVVLPVVSLRTLLNMPDVAVNWLTRVIVMRGDASVGFVVDGIDRLLAIPQNQIEQVDDATGTMDATLLDGVIKGAEGESPIRLLNPSRVLHGQFVRLGISATSAGNVATMAAAPSIAAPMQALVSLLSFCLGRQEYALPLDRVREIIPMPDHISELPRQETAVLGVVTLRDRLLPLVSLRALLGLPIDEEPGHRGKIVVLSIGEAAVGVAVDATREILRLNPEFVDPAPTLLTRGEGDAEIASICRLEGGRRLVALLSPDRLFRAELVDRILDEQGACVPGLQPEANAMSDEQFVIFRLGTQDYGIPIVAVSEIARLPEQVTRLPKAPSFIDGVINLRGRVVPVIDLRRRFLGDTEQGASRRILMVSIGGVLAGLLVDAVSEILKVPVDAIRPAPELSSEQMRLISRVANVEASGRLILLVDAAHLLDQLEAEVLTKFSASSREAAVIAS